MKKNKVQTTTKKLLVLFLPFIMLMAGCSQENEIDDTHVEVTTPQETTASETAEEGDVTFTDDAGRHITLEAPVEKIIALQPSDVEIIYELGEEDTLVAVGEYADYPQEATELPTLGSGMNMNTEEIIAKTPDVVIVGYMNGQEAMYEALEEAGITVIVFQDETIEEVYETVNLYGQILNAEEEADTLVSDMQTSFETIEQAAEEKETPGTIYYETSPLEFGLWAAGSQTFMDDIGQLLNLENIFKDQESFVEVSEEQIIGRQPDYIVTTTLPMEGQMTPAEEILQRPGWGVIPAVEKQQVLAIDGSKVTRPGPRLVDAAEELYEAVYGEPVSANPPDEEAVNAG